MKRYIILEPYSEQSLAILKVLKRDIENEIYAGIMKEKYKNEFLKYYTGTININEEDIIQLDKEYIIIPTTAQSTSLYFSLFDECKLNEIIFKKKNLFVSDKPKILEFTEKIGVPVPKTYYSREDIKSYPIFYKQNFERGGGVRGLAKSKEELYQIKDENLIYQEYITGNSTFGVTFLAKDGEILEYDIHEETLSIPKDGGSAVIIKEIYDDRLLSYTKNIIRNLDYSGWGLSEFKYCPLRDEYYFMEINAKFWASCEFSFLKNKFIKLLFNIDKYNLNYKEKVNGVIFIDRLIKSNIKDIYNNKKYLTEYKKIKYKNPFKVFIKSKILKK